MLDLVEMIWNLIQGTKDDRHTVKICKIKSKDYVDGEDLLLNGKNRSGIL